MINWFKNWKLWKQSPAKYPDVKPCMVTDQEFFERVVEQALNAKHVSFDIESNGFYHYPERVCLIQLAVKNQIFLIDPLTLDDFSILSKLFSDETVEKIFHAADYDIRSLDRDWGIRIHNLFDTGIAAAFVGSDRRGLAAVLKEYLNVEIIKNKKLQRADWSQRPLTQELTNYASEDVRYLKNLREVLCQKLAQLGRTSWVEEEFSRLSAIKHTPQDNEWGFLSIKGNRTLDGRGLAILRSLYNLSEGEAVSRDRPPFKIFPDSVLIALASSPGTDLNNIKGIGRYARNSGAKGIASAITSGINATRVKRPPKTNSRINFDTNSKGRENSNERLKLLKEWRFGHGNKLKIDASLLWPANSLKRLSKYPDSLGSEFESKEVREWQKMEFADSLTRFVASID